MSRWAAVALALALLQASAGGRAATRTEVKQQLNSTLEAKRLAEQKVKKGLKDLKHHEMMERDAVGELAQLNREVDAKKRDAQVHVHNLGLVQDRLDALRESEARVSEQEGSDRQALSVQLRAVQRSRARQGAALLFGARTPAQVAARTNALRELSLNTRRLVLGLRKRRDLIEAYEVEGTRRKEELVQQRSQAEMARKRAAAEAARKKHFLLEIQNKTVHLKRSLEADKRVAASLEQRASRMQDFLETLDRERSAQNLAKARNERGIGLRKMHRASGPTSFRAGSPWPVKGRLLSRFGKQRHPIFNVPVFNRNIEIAAPFGGPIKAVAAGTVEYVGEMQDFGKLVVIDHGGGWKSVYGYASAASVQKDQAVAQGDIIGEVGEHGAAGQPSLYFQISQNARPQDPLRYLSRR
jgi:septal ring factor EnvC (AmiA/AmiB activator)